jgi:hypothetical protein
LVSGLTSAFGGYFDVVAESLLYDGEHELEVGGNDDSRLVEPGGPKAHKRLSVACHCGGPLGQPTPGALDLRCAKCGDVTPVRWPDAQTREWDPRIAYVVGDAGDRGLELKQKVEGTVVKCGNCGAPLAQQGRQRALVCTHCQAENFLSDQVFTKLFPKPESHVFYLVYELDDDAYADAFAYLTAKEHVFFDDEQEELVRKRASPLGDRLLAAQVRRAIAKSGYPWDEDKLDEGVAREIASRSDLDADTMARIDKRLTNEVRRAIVSDRTSAPFVERWLASESPGTRAAAASFAKGEALRKCAADESYEVRAVVAGRADTPADILAKLRDDPDGNVREKARANASYQPGFFTKLFGG